MKSPWKQSSPWSSGAWVRRPWTCQRKIWSGLGTKSRLPYIITGIHSICWNFWNSSRLLFDRCNNNFHCRLFSHCLYFFVSLYASPQECFAFSPTIMSVATALLIYCKNVILLQLFCNFLQKCYIFTTTIIHRLYFNILKIWAIWINKPGWHGSWITYIKM